MRANPEAPESANSGASRAHRRLGNPITTYRRLGGLAVLIAAGAVALAAFSPAGPSHAASLGKRSRSGNSARISESNGAGASSKTTSSTDKSTRLLDEWAACERSNGDPNQADPTVSHQVIYITVEIGALPNWDPNDTGATCGEYLAGARSAVAGGQPVKGWGDNALYVQYANCMRANGYPTFPYPSGKIEPDGNESTNFNGTGIDPLSPAFLNGTANQTCGKQIDAPAWWINSWGPPGSVDAYPAGTNPNSPLPSGPPNAPKPSIAPGVKAARTAQAPPHNGSGNNGSAAASG